MKAIILVGGQGMRLRPLTDRVPKNVVPLCNAPFLTYPIRQLRRAGVRDIVLSVAYRPGVIRRTLGDGRRLGVRIRYAVEKRPLGTAGAVKNAERHVAGHPVLVLNGDILTDLDHREMMRFHRRKRSSVTIALARVKDPRPYGLVLLDRKKKVSRFVEKPRPREVVDNTINAGCYLFEPGILRLIPAGRPVSTERELFPFLLAAGIPFHGFVWNGYWMDIGTARRYLESQWDVLAGRFPVPAGYRPDRGGVYWGRGVKTGTDVVVRGPSLVGHRCVLEEGVRIRPYTVLGDRCRIGRGSHLERSLLWGGAGTGEHARLDRVILGNGFRLPQGARPAPGSVRVRTARGRKR